MKCQGVTVQMKATEQYFLVPLLRESEVHNYAFILKGFSKLGGKYPTKEFLFANGFDRNDFYKLGFFNTMIKNKSHKH